jgi:tRNA-binding protein
MPTFQEFLAFDIRVGTVRAAREHPTARVPALQLEIDFGPAGVRQSSAQLTRRYAAAELVGRQVIAVLNFPPRRVADFTSEVLVLGAMPDAGDVVLLHPDTPVADGVRIG